jgi:serine protease Do
VTEDGKVVGISARGFSGANNLGFAIPASTARRIVAGLVKDGVITRSYIGLVPVALQDFENFYALGASKGLLVSSVDPGSPAARAGLRGGDIVLAIDGTVVTEKLESRVGEEWVCDKWGLSVRKVSRAYARENQLDDTSGVLVIGVQPGYPADLAGLSRGDIVMKINQQPVTTLDVLKAAQAAYEAKPEPTLFEAQRNRRVSLYIIKP